MTEMRGVLVLTHELDQWRYDLRAWAERSEAKVTHKRVSRIRELVVTYA